MQIREIVLNTANPALLKAFYGSVLNIPVPEEGPDGFALKTGHTTILFRQSPAGSSPFYHFAFNIPANRIEGAAAWLQEKGVALIFLEDYHGFVADFTGWHARSVYFFDPGGNIVELIARFDLDNASERPFSAQQWLSVSEIGLVFPEKTIMQETSDLLEKYQLPYFDKQPPSDHFKVLGDDEGLFIIVPEGRPWYPTKDGRAVKAPLSVRFSHKDREGLLQYH